MTELENKIRLEELERIKQMVVKLKKDRLTNYNINAKKSVKALKFEEHYHKGLEDLIGLIEHLKQKYENK